MKASVILTNALDRISRNVDQHSARSVLDCVYALIAKIDREDDMNDHEAVVASGDKPVEDGCHDDKRRGLDPTVVELLVDRVVDLECQWVDSLRVRQRQDELSKQLGMHGAKINNIEGALIGRVARLENKVKGMVDRQVGIGSMLQRIEELESSRATFLVSELLLVSDRVRALEVKER